MARETKIGLVVGLAFIICFAVILANRGRPATVGAHLPYVVDRGVTGSQVAHRGDASRQAGAPANRRTAATRQAKSQSPTTESNGAAGHRGVLDEAPSSGAVVLGPDTSPERSPSPHPQPNTGSSLASQPATDRSRLLDELASQVGEGVRPTGDDRPSTNLTSEPRALAGAEPATKGPADRSGGGVESSTPVRKDSVAAVTGLRHTVASGETLWKIADRFYGARSAKVVDALHAANRSILKSPDVLRVGMELSLPPVDGFALRGSTTPGSSRALKPAAQEQRGGRTQTATGPASGPRAEPAPTTRPPEPPIRWYEVKKNDRYAGIARDVLGDAARWREIYELNKDKFPDPDRIREGVRIKIPSPHVATSEGTRH